MRTPKGTCWGEGRAPRTAGHGYLRRWGRYSLALPMMARM